MQLSTRVFEHTSVATSDRSFNYGDGCFTTMRVRHGKIELLDRHIERLKNDASILGIDFSFKNELQEFLCGKPFQDSLLKADNGVIKVLLSRGQGGRGYMPPVAEEKTSACYVSMHDYFPLKPENLRLLLSSVILSNQPVLAGLKHCNRLEQVLAKQALREYNIENSTYFDDVLMLDSEHNIIESSSANVFFFDGVKWVTPKLSLSGVNGVMRQYIIEHQNAIGMVCVETDIKLSTLSSYLAMFICNAVHGIIPVKLFFDGQQSYSFDTSIIENIAASLNQHITLEM